MTQKKSVKKSAPAPVSKTVTESQDVSAPVSAEEALVTLRARPSLKEMFSHVDLDANDDGGLMVHGLDKDLHAHFANAEKRNISRLERLGYVPIDNIDTNIGYTADGTFKHPETGEDIKVMVCLKEHREYRQERLQKSAERVTRAVYADDIKAGREVPMSGLRTPPDGYESNNF